MKKIYLTSMALLALVVAHASQPRKVLIIGIDGTRSDALQQANTPNIDALLVNGFYTFDSWHCGITVSAPSWSDVMCGVWESKHGVTSNSYTGSHYDQYPYFITRAKEVKPNLKCVQITEWAPMSDNVYNDGWDVKIKVPDGAGTPTAAAAVSELADPNLDAMFVYFDAVDLAGHANGFTPSNPSYISAIEGVDGHIGTVLNALYARPDYANEDWLILLVTDHGGIGTGHGGGLDVERRIWWIGSGNSVQHQEVVGVDPGSYQYSGFPYFVSDVDTALLKDTPVQTDIAVTALHHLIYDSGINPETKPEWNLDGKSWLTQMTASVENTTKENNDLMVYPNPASDIVTIWFNNLQNSSVIYTVTNESGQTVVVSSIIKSTNKLSLDIASLKPGLYFVTIQLGTTSLSKKIVKL